MPQRLSAFQWALLAPGALLLLGLLVVPIALMAVESFHPFVGGRVGAAVAGPVLRRIWRHNLTSLKAQIER